MFMYKWKEKVNELCGIDGRSLALFRMGLALVILGDLFMRLLDLKAHYTDEGVLPRSTLLEDILTKWHFSLHVANGTWEFELVLFLLAAVFACALLMGYQTRLASIVSWILMISLQLRNPIILQGGDIVLKVLLFWSMFLPLGAYWSLDQFLSKKDPPASQLVSVSTFAILLQVCFIYWFSALLKNDESWTQSGTAIWYALSIEQYSTPLGIYLLNFPVLLKILTFATYILEAFVPFLAFSPFWTGPLRFATAVMFILFHLVGLNFTMELAIFPYVCTVAWILFIPKWFWEHIMKMKSSVDKPWKASWISNGLATLFILYIFLWNLSTLGWIRPPAPAVGILLAIDQTWDMFAPTPLREDGWYVIPAKLRDGTEVDLFTGGKPVDWEKPHYLSATYPNDHWRSYMMNLMIGEYGPLPLRDYARYLCREWDKSHSFDKKILSFDVVFMLKVNSVDDPHPIPEKTVLWHQVCGSPPTKLQPEKIALPPFKKLKLDKG